jgi:hypothetical protein
MRRKPVYDKDLPNKRVVSAPSGLWFPQFRESVGPGTREYDPWQNIHGAADFGTACMTAFGPKEKGR